jgi:hypothetical protein
MREALVSFPSLHPKLWLDEWNVNAGFDPRMSGTYGAAFVAAVLSTAQADGLDRSAFYDAIDDSPVDNFGLLTQTGAPKPDFWTFDFWHDLSGRLLSVNTTPPLETSPGTDELGAVSSLSVNGVVHVLIYNFAPTGPVGTPHQHLDTQFKRQVTVSIAGLSAKRYAVQVSRIDTDHSGALESVGTIRGTNAVIHLQANGQSVSLVQLTPDS